MGKQRGTEKRFFPMAEPLKGFAQWIRYNIFPYGRTAKGFCPTAWAKGEETAWAKGLRIKWKANYFNLQGTSSPKWA
jgi:hypothetical protein